ncbi:MAG: chorismate mutase [Gemmatimonadetes bacterium]|nr:chorismate mutase [Gemmatimonadota bacterium]MDA1102887.1 chorismate mutase [Gemmatimonadota bacterium]
MTDLPPDAALDDLRKQIQAVDRELVQIVGRRRELVLAVGAAKAALGVPILDPEQEARVVRRAAEIARESHADEELMRDIIWRIIASARAEQEGRTRWGPPLSSPGADEVAGP